MTDKEKIHQILSSLWKNDDSVGKTYYNQALQDVQTTIDLQEEPVSEELEQAAVEAFKKIVDGGRNSFLEIFKAGAKWQKNHLWKPAEGSDLPVFDMEVVALLDNGKVVFAHRPNPDGFDGRSLTTGEIEHYIPKTYDKGGWNIPDVKYWLDCELPNME